MSMMSCGCAADEAVTEAEGGATRSDTVRNTWKERERGGTGKMQGRADKNSGDEQQKQWR